MDVLQLNTLGLVLSIVVAAICLDRLNHLTWRTARPLFTALYLVCALGCMWAGSEAWRGAMEWWTVLILCALYAALIVTRHRWRHGAPAEITRPSPLGPPELSRNSTLK